MLSEQRDPFFFSFSYKDSNIKVMSKAVSY